MSFATRCPACQTLFRVSLGQLQMYEGQVRCGHCRAVFSGIEHLAAADSEAWQSLALEAEAGAAAADESPKAPTGPQFLEASASQRASKITLPKLGSAPKALRIIIWVLTGLVVLQLLWWQRFSWLPVNAGDWFKATPFSSLFAINPSQALTIEGSGLVDRGGDTLQLEITLSNGSERPARWPHLKVDLMDSQGTLVASRLLKPSDYSLRSSGDQSSKIQSPDAKPAVIQAGSLIEITTVLDLSSLKKRLPGTIAAGFEIQIYDRSVDLI